MADTKVASARLRLLEVAGRLFYAEGIHAVGVDRIIAEAQVAKATLYAHFSGKEELVAAYLSGRSDEWQAWIDAELPRRSDEPTGQLLAIFDLLTDRFTSPDFRGCPFINAAAEYPGPGVVADQVSAHRRRVRDVFGALLERTNLAEPAWLTETLVALYDGAIVAGQLDRSPTVASAATATAGRLLSAS
ncbi:MAG: TetR family transcriptional regulator [Acidimicrobiales bacterium]